MYERGCADQPGTGLFALLSSVDPAEATDDELIDVVAGWERIKCFAEARQAAALVAFADRRPGGAAHGVSEFAADEIAPALSIARGTAEARIGFARGLTALPSTRAALASGRIGLGVAHRIVDGLSTSALSPEQVRAAEEQVLADAEGRTPAQVAARIARTVLALDPAATDRRHTEAVANRKVVCCPQPDGMAGIWALLRADDAAVVMSCLRSQATSAHAPGDDRTLDQRLADSLVDLHTGHLRNPVPAARVCTCTGQDRSAEKDRSRSRATNDAAEPFRPIGPAVKVVVAATTLLGLDEQPGELARSPPSPTAPGGGSSPIPPAALCWMSAGPATGPRPPSPTTSAPGTGPAASSAAGYPPTAATSTTSSAIPTARPRRRTSAPSAATITG
jgi:hypothetical protein